MGNKRINNIACSHVRTLGHLDVCSTVWEEEAENLRARRKKQSRKYIAGGLYHVMLVVSAQTRVNNRNPTLIPRGNGGKCIVALVICTVYFESNPPLGAFKVPDNNYAL